MDIRQTQDRILEETLSHVAFEGWTDKALALGVIDAGMEPVDRLRFFPGGVPDLMRHWSAWSDRRMFDRLETIDMSNLPVGQRIAVAVRARIEANALHREAVRRALSWFALPNNAGLAARLTYDTVNAIWYAVGDRATDIRFYTKRATLAAIYAATVLYWLDDPSDRAEETWAFLDRRIADMALVPRFRDRIGRALDALPDPFRLFRRGDAFQE